MKRFFLFSFFILIFAAIVYAPAPTISDVHEENLNFTSVDIVWTTLNLSNSTVRYSTNSTLFNPTAVSNIANVTNHVIYIPGLLENTRYYYDVLSCMNLTSCDTSGIYNFITPSSDTSFRNNSNWMIALAIFLIGLIAIFCFLFSIIDREHFIYKIFLLFVAIIILTLSVNIMRDIINDSSLLSLAASDRLSSQLDTLYLIMIVVSMVSGFYFAVYFVAKILMWTSQLRGRNK